MVVVAVNAKRAIENGRLSILMNRNSCPAGFGPSLNALALDEGGSAIYFIF